MGSLTQKGGERRGEDCNNTAEARKRGEHGGNEEGRMDLKREYYEGRKERIVERDERIHF